MINPAACGKTSDNKQPDFSVIDNQDSARTAVIAVDVRNFVDKILKARNFPEIYSSVILESFSRGSIA